LPAFSTFTFLILFLFLLEASKSIEACDLTCGLGNSIFPRTVGPESFLTFALMVSDLGSFSCGVSNLGSLTSLLDSVQLLLVESLKLKI